MPRESFHRWLLGWVCLVIGCCILGVAMPVISLGIFFIGACMQVLFLVVSLRWPRRQEEIESGPEEEP